MRLKSQLLAGALVTEFAGLVAVVCLALVARAHLPLGVWYPVKAAGLFSLMMLLTLKNLRQHHPFGRFGRANQLTTARAVIVVLVASLVGESPDPREAALTAAAGFGAAMLDGVDGWLARRTGMASAFGARFDVEIDALLIQALAILAWTHGKAGPWVVLSGLLRYAFLGAGWVWPWLRRPLAPTRRGRVICGLQIAALVVAIIPAVTAPISAAIAACGLAALCYSFLIDLLRLWRGASER